ncbi:nicotinamide-nucleotide amidohydrolase family protein [candidate division WOR-3 bacterium]|nr:nicotinamide-nucleotide amidohydrolase family protein [candidate division WOR-3 bacterium]
MRVTPGAARRTPRVLGQLLLSKGLTLAVAESCTGGLVGDRLTDVPGSSQYFAGGVIAYSNAAKVSLLGVSRQTLDRWGAVSEQTVREMAAGVCRRFKARVGVATSGVAGPGGGTRGKPVGLVHVCVRAGRRVAVERYLFRGSRRSVKERSAAAALEFCRRLLEEVA